MNPITELLDLEDLDIMIDDIQIQGQTKTIFLKTPPSVHFCPSCGYRMYSRGVKQRKIRHPILQDGFTLILILKQRRWRCTNPLCSYDGSESFRFVNKNRRTTNEISVDEVHLDIISKYFRQFLRNREFLILMNMIFRFQKGSGISQTLKFAPHERPQLRPSQKTLNNYVIIGACPSRKTFKKLGKASGSLTTRI